VFDFSADPVGDSIDHCRVFKLSDCRSNHFDSANDVSCGANSHRRTCSDYVNCPNIGQAYCYNFGDSNISRRRTT
jgi:hypothetical protein